MVIERKILHHYDNPEWGRREVHASFPSCDLALLPEEMTPGLLQPHCAAVVEAIGGLLGHPTIKVDDTVNVSYH